MTPEFETLRAELNRIYNEPDAPCPPQLLEAIGMLCQRLRTHPQDYVSEEAEGYDKILAHLMVSCAAMPVPEGEMLLTKVFDALENAYGAFRLFFDRSKEFARLCTAGLELLASKSPAPDKRPLDQLNQK